MDNLIIVREKLQIMKLFSLLLILSTAAMLNCIDKNAHSAENSFDKPANPERRSHAKDLPTLQIDAPKDSKFSPKDGIVVFRWDQSTIELTNGLIQVFDESGNVWHEINYFDDSLDSMSEPGGKFRPFKFRSGDFQLEFESVARSENWSGGPR